MTLSRIFSISFLMLWMIIYFIFRVFLRNVKNTIIYSSIEAPFVIAVITDSNALHWKMNGINMKSKESIRKKIILNDQYMYLSNEKSLALGASIILIEKNNTIAV